MRPAIYSILLSCLTFFFGFSSQAYAATPIGAKAIVVEGQVNVISIKDKKLYKVEIGDSFIEGDRITTGADGLVEIEFDTGDSMRVDRKTDITIRSLNRDEGGSTFSIFNLTIGRVKSWVAKLPTSDSKFNYHTKAVICGVAGSPPHAVEVLGNQTTKAFLFGKSGDVGSFFITAQGETVFLMPGMMTAVTLGAAPLAPFLIQEGLRSGFLISSSQAGGAPAAAGLSTGAVAPGVAGLSTGAIIGGGAAIASGVAIINEVTKKDETVSP